MPEKPVSSTYKPLCSSSSPKELKIIAILRNVALTSAPSDALCPPAGRQCCAVTPPNRPLAAPLLSCSHPTATAQAQAVLSSHEAAQAPLSPLPAPFVRWCLAHQSRAQRGELHPSVRSKWEILDSATRHPAWAPFLSSHLPTWSLLQPNWAAC